MDKPDAIAASTRLLEAEAPKQRQRPSLRAAGITAAIIAGIFALPLYRLVEFALGSELYSYIVLIPFVSAYMAWQKRKDLPRIALPSRGLAVSLLALGAVALGAGFLAPSLINLATEDRLALATAAFLFTATGALAWFCGWRMIRALLFPIGFLFFMCPIPSGVMPAIELAMQHGSAAVAQFLFRISGTAVFYQDLSFQLPGISLYVARECSGIRSTLALTIVSVVSSYFFLQSPAKRWLLVLAVAPLALVRNGFRIFTLGELCVRIGPEIIDSPLHHRGGPIFFAISLVPFLLLLVFLHRRDRLEKIRA